MVQVMDRGLAHFAEIAGKWNPKADPEFPGTGAAGGLGFAFLTFTSAVLESGIQIVLEETRLREYVKDADLVITGEGRLDGQTVMGKAPVGVARIAKEFHKPVLAFSGSVTRAVSYTHLDVYKRQFLYSVSWSYNLIFFKRVARPVLAWPSSL